MSAPTNCVKCEDVQTQEPTAGRHWAAYCYHGAKWLYRVSHSDKRMRKVTPPDWCPKIKREGGCPEQSEIER